MSLEHQRGTYGFRFAESAAQPLCGLFAVGHERETGPAYDWNGLTRTDGPLLLFQYTLDGIGELEVDGRIHRPDPGRAFLVEIPGNHRYRLPAGSPAWEFIFILLRPRLVAPLWEDIKNRLGEVPYLPQGSGPISVLNDLYREARAGRITDPYTASSHTYRFMMELSRFSTNKGMSDSMWPQAVKTAVQFMERHYDRMIGQEQLSLELGVSKYHFLRTFTRFVGMTPGEYLSRIRIEKAVGLLRQTDWSMEQIAASVGYSSGSYFIKVFRKLTGQTPAQFRSDTELPYSRLFFD
ncbi:helix-turn-helix transcriptional regulator [Paenibacillus harenae]|uniref:helix-turn-helix transcriptional regulator n=1 Tax=Paenibacillus harenae TaxID=306543 RepID=UPI0003FF91D8|nr:AraC family transcriptional regulator [Paenibacillus harenae]